MNKAVFVQIGENLDYCNNTNQTIEAGTILDLSTRIGVAGTTMLPEELGSVHVCGVFEIGKTKKMEKIDQGSAVFFDGIGITADASDGNAEGAKAYTPAGYAANAGTDAEEVILVKLMG